MSKATTALNAYNVTSNFLPADMNWTLVSLPFKASTAIAEGAIIVSEISSNTTTGNYTIASATEPAAGANFIGIMAEPIVSTDTDYATAGKRKSVYVPTSPFAKAYFKVGAGTFTAADVGKTVELHSDYKSLAVDTAGKAATITDYISSTKGKCQLWTTNLTETA